MAATYTKCSRDLPSSQRAAVITNCVAGDKIDLRDVLGRPANHLIFLMTDPGDIVEYKINHLRKLTTVRRAEDSLSVADQVWGVFGTEKFDLWLAADTFTGTGSSQLETEAGLEIASLEIVSLTLSTGTTITIEVS